MDSVGLFGVVPSYSECESRTEFIRLKAKNLVPEVFSLPLSRRLPSLEVNKLLQHSGWKFDNTVRDVARPNRNPDVNVTSAPGSKYQTRPRRCSDFFQQQRRSFPNRVGEASAEGSRDTSRDM